MDLAKANTCSTFLTIKDISADVVVIYSPPVCVYVN